jgi:hypothetical protein
MGLRRKPLPSAGRKASSADHLAGREAIFPAGTWWLHSFSGVKCAELGATAPPI